MSRTERLFALIDLLRTHRTPVTARQLAARLDVSDRSVYRDIDMLRALGAPIDGQAGVGFVLRPGFLLPPLMLTVDELDALSLGASWVRLHGDPALAAAAASALARIAAVLPEMSPALGDAPTLVTAATDAPPDPVHVAHLRKAIRQQRKIAVGYEDADGRSSERVLWPIAIAYFDACRILVAWCEMRGAFRHFRIDRLRPISLLDERYPEQRSGLVKRWRAEDRMSGLRS